MILKDPDPAALREENEKLKKKIAELEHLAVLDPLTGVHNRRYFNERLQQEIQRATRHKTQLSLLMIDIDDFKKCNDAYGHTTGDCLLVEISKVLVKLSRATDIICRYGGDEFAMILPETNAAQAKVLAYKIKKGVQDLCLKCRPTISIGVADVEENQDVLHLLTQADKALYKAKKMGKNRVAGLMEIV
jgi:diguanylate cyclase (GGDEF)-like protein